VTIQNIGASKPAPHEERTSEVIFDRAVRELRRISPEEGGQAPDEYAGRISDEQLQDLLSACVRFLAAKRAVGPIDAFGENHVTATEVAIAATGMLEAVNLELFELTLWNGWGRA
jgi:hypothetical protein